MTDTLDAIQREIVPELYEITPVRELALNSVGSEIGHRSLGVAPAVVRAPVPVELMSDIHGIG